MVNRDEISTDDISHVLDDIVKTKEENLAESLFFDILSGLRPDTIELLKNLINDF